MRSLEIDQQRWASLWNEVGTTGDPLVPYQDLRKRYSEPQRRYHTWRHITSGLDEFEAAAHLAQNSNCIRLAYYFHDSVYNLGPGVKDSDNVDQSAQLAVSVLQEAQLPQTIVRTVEGLILVTKHIVPPNGVDEGIMVDIDFTILGKSQEEFDQYERDIQTEYSWVDPKMFRTTRAGILKRFLQRPKIFNTEYFSQKYEAQAIENLQRSIDNLS